ncbi:MAG: hypothetical protein A2X49_13110 [Lentisphaerae bacterium GWF2_52_8]|nr:MAG: hypothetical protein A2X49_13110 [Lentisphaerae bacterium GWF2_52_8]
MSQRFAISSFFYILFAGFFCLQPAAFAVSEKWVITLGGAESLEECGLKFNIFKETAASPLRPLNTYVLTDKLNQKHDGYLPMELWFHDQCAGYWSCEDASIFVGKLSLNPPGEKELGKRVSEDAFEEWKGKAPTRWEPKDIETWLTRFAEMAEKNNKLRKEELSTPLISEPENIKSPQGTANIQKYKIKEGRYKEAYLVSNPKDSAQCVLILYMLEDMSDKDKCKKAISQSVESVSFFPPRPAGKTKKQGSSSLKPGKKPAWSNGYAASREKAIESLNGLDDWSYSETENFIILSNSRQKARINEIKGGIEKAHSAFKSVFPPLKPLDVIRVLRVFDSYDEYLAYVGKEKEHKEIGSWLGSKREFVISPAPWLQGAKRSEDLLRMIAFVGFQQYFYYSNGELWGSNWFRDGTSFFFQELDFRGSSGGRVEIGISDYWYSEYKKIGGVGDISKLVRQADKEFYDKDKSHKNYIRVWALMYYLYKGASLMKGKSDHVEIPGKYYKALVETRDNAKATDAAFAGIDFADLRRSIDEFFNNGPLVSKSKNYQAKPVIELTAP